MANASAEEEYSCLGDGVRASHGFDIAPMHCQHLQPHQEQHARNPHPHQQLSLQHSSSHLYHTTDRPSSEYSLAFSSAPETSDVSICATHPSRLLLDLQHLQAQPHPPGQPSTNSVTDFDMFSNMNEPPASSALFQFDSTISPNTFSAMTRVQDGVHELTNLHLYATAPSPSSASDISSHSASSSAVSSPISADFDEASALMAPIIACASCKRSHIKCDSGRPCQNCLKHPSKAMTCRDAIPKPRGRPKGGSKAAAEAIYLARLQQQQVQQQQLREHHYHHQSQFPRPRVMSLPQQARPQLPLLQLQQYHQQQPHQQHQHLLSRSSPTSPAAVEHCPIRFTRRPSLPAWHNHPYAMSNQSGFSRSETPASWGIQVPGSSFSAPAAPSSSLTSVAHDILHPVAAPNLMPPPNQSLEALHILQERPPTDSSHQYSSCPPPYSRAPAMESASQQLQHELIQLQIMRPNLCDPLLTADVKLEPRDLDMAMSPASGGSGHDQGMVSLLCNQQQQQREAQADLQDCQQKLHEQLHNEQAMLSMHKQLYHQ